MNVGGWELEVKMIGHGYGGYRQFYLLLLGELLLCSLSRGLFPYRIHYNYVFMLPL
jgi:hypothetical protein